MPLKRAARWGWSRSTMWSYLVLEVGWEFDGGDEVNAGLADGLEVTVELRGTVTPPRASSNTNR